TAAAAGELWPAPRCRHLQRYAGGWRVLPSPHAPGTMMAISAISGSTAAPTTQAQSLGLQDFLKILLTQLNYQDPLKPMDNQQFMAQMAQFTSLEQSQRVNDKLDQLITNQAALQSVGLIGRAVDVETGSGKVSGTVA